MKLDFSFFTRKKKYDAVNLHETKLSRVLGLVDITAIGVSCTLGNGIYVLAGDVIANLSGPSIILAFVIAGFATFLAGICYAEFGARVPRSGSAYIYIYVTIGEFVAFILGWDLILEYGVSSGASALSRYIDALVDNKIQQTFQKYLPMNLNGIAPYPDFLAFAFVILITLMMIVGVKESSLLNKIFTALNILVIIFIVAFGVSKTDIKYWQIKTDNLTWIDAQNKKQNCSTSPRCGEGGFFPFGFNGLIQGAAKCFYAYIGFDAIASTGEEVNNPKRNIPISIVVTLLIVSLCYISTSIVLTLMIPYYLVNQDIPLPQAFDYVGLSWAKYVISIGAIASLVTCLYAAMFPMPRVVYSLASDGLIFKFLSYVTPKLKTPIMASIFSGLFAGILSLIFDLNQLIDMLSIGTLMAYSVVAICVLVLRYRPAALSDSGEASKTNIEEMKLEEPSISNSNATIVTVLFGRSSESFLKRCFKPTQVCTEDSSRLVNTLTILASIELIFISLFIKVLDPTTAYFIVLITIFLILVLIKVFIIWRQPQAEFDTFKTPFIPILPLASVFINTYLMMALSIHTWIRFGIWFILGVIVYFSYGMHHSLENKNK